MKYTRWLAPAVMLLPLMTTALAQETGSLAVQVSQRLDGATFVGLWARDGSGFHQRVGLDGEDSVSVSGLPAGSYDIAVENAEGEILAKGIGSIMSGAWNSEVLIE